MIRIIKRTDPKEKTAEPTKALPERRLPSKSAVEFSITVKVWIKDFRQRQHFEEQRTFRSLFRES